MNNRFFSLVFFLVIIPVLSLSAEIIRDSDFPELGSSAVISMVTVYPGTEIYSLFGHSSYRVYDPEKGIDWMFNYGTFDFDDPMFVFKFVRGQLDYYLSVDGFKRAYRFYSLYENRRVVEQVLNFNRDERDTVFRFLLENSLPENRYYKYDFINDNCSTRISDVLLKCFGNDAVFPEGMGENSFRDMINVYLESYPLLKTGINLVLGSPSDRRPAGISRYFLPVPLIEGFDNAVMKSGNSRKKLVAYKKVLNSPSVGDPERKNSPDYFFISVLLVLAAEIYMLLSCYLKKMHLKTAYMLLSSFEMLFIVFSGAAGSLMFYLWFLSDHAVPDWNFYILWISPLSLLYPVLSSFKKMEKKAPPVSRILFFSALSFLPVLLTGVQSVSLSMLFFYLDMLLIYFRRGDLHKSVLFTKLISSSNI